MSLAAVIPMPPEEDPPIARRSDANGRALKIEDLAHTLYRRLLVSRAFTPDSGAAADEARLAEGYRELIHLAEGLLRALDQQRYES